MEILGFAGVALGAAGMISGITLQIIRYRRRADLRSATALYSAGLGVAVLGGAFLIFYYGFTYWSWWAALPSAGLGLLGVSRVATAWPVWKRSLRK